MKQISITQKYVFAEKLGNHCATLASNLHIVLKIKMHHGFTDNDALSGLYVPN